MSETRWIVCFLAAVGLGVLVRIGLQRMDRIRTARGRLLFAVAGLGIFALVQALLLAVTLSITALQAAFVPALLAVGLADLLALAVILIGYFTRHKRRLTEAQKIELSEL